MQQSPSVPASTPPQTATVPRKIGVAVDLSDDSLYTVTWAIQHHIQPHDTVVLLHVSTTTHDNNDTDEMKKMKNYFHLYTISKLNDFAKPLLQAQIPFNLHIVMDREINKRLGVEVNSLNLSALVVGRGGSVGEYCVRHCECPVVVVGSSDEADGGDLISTANSGVGRFAENSTANSVLAPPKETYVEEIDDMLRKYNEGLLSRGDFNKLFDRVFDQIIEEELMDDTDEQILMSLRLENERRRQSHTSTRRKHTKRRHT